MEEWKERFKKEYYELKERFQKLDMMIGKYEKGQLEFESKCPIDLLKGQRSTMWNYLRILEQRAKIEAVFLCSNRMESRTVFILSKLCR